METACRIALTALSGSCRKPYRPNVHFGRQGPPLEKFRQGRDGFMQPAISAKPVHSEGKNITGRRKVGSFRERRFPGGCVSAGQSAQATFAVADGVVTGPYPVEQGEEQIVQRCFLRVNQMPARFDGVAPFAHQHDG